MKWKMTIEIQITYVKVKEKVKVVPVHFFTEHHAMKAYWGSGGISPLIL
jgi:hypothetical protein